MEHEGGSIALAVILLVIVGAVAVFGKRIVSETKWFLRRAIDKYRNSK